MTEAQSQNQGDSKEPKKEKSEVERLTDIVKLGEVVWALPGPLKIIGGGIFGGWKLWKLSKDNPEQAKQTIGNIFKGSSIGLGCATAAVAGALSEVAGLGLLGASAVADGVSPGAGEGMRNLSRVCCAGPIVIPATAALLAHPATRERIIDGFVNISGGIQRRATGLKDTLRQRINR